MARQKLSIQSKSTQEKTLQEGFKEFTTHCKIKNLAEKTLVYYQAYFTKFETFLNSIGINHIAGIKKPTIDNYILHLKEQTEVNDITVNTSLRAVRAFVYYWQSLGYCPTFKIMLIKADKTIKETYTESELKLLLEKPDMKDFSEYRNWVIINFLLATGVRVGELVSLHVGDVDFEDAIVKVKRGKSRRERHLPLSKTIIKILMEYVNVRDGEADNFLFCNSYGQRLDENSCKHTINSYNKRRGVCKTSLHLFRHTFAKMFILNGGDIFRLQKILGHKSIEIVKEYVNMFTNDLKQDFDDFNPLENISKNKGNYISMRTGGKR
jgi:integrase/recombinase XerD